MFRLLCYAFHAVVSQYFHVKLSILMVLQFLIIHFLRCVCAHIIALVKRPSSLKKGIRRRANTRNAKCLFQYHPVWSVVICFGWVAYISWCGTCFVVGSKDHGNHEAWLHSAIFMAGSSFYWERNLSSCTSVYPEWREYKVYLYKIQEIIFHYSKFDNVVRNLIIYQWW